MYMRSEMLERFTQKHLCPLVWIIISPHFYIALTYKDLLQQIFPISEFETLQMYVAFWIKMYCVLEVLAPSLES